ncbi:MAG TPA: tetratricopeptide repeat protein [Vicinamibacterales bacterium]|jgi:tol-pal system protein YbgF|nr:tetratricopeptide repeat protein [Acidobacteriota bacterium]HQX81185.1 tetratricopeptide repeat protein [Vicinamibacterales bacterium]
MNVRSLTRTGLFVIAVAGSLAPGVASAQNREHQQLFADVRMLQEQTQQLRLAVASLSEALAKVGPRLDEQAGATRKLFADQGLVIGALTDNARILREKLDATNVSLSKEAHEMETMRQELAAQRTLLTQIITLLTAASAATDPSAAAAAGTGATPPVATPPPAVPAPPQNPQRAFDSAFGDYARGDFEMAITGFEYYIKIFPTSPDAAKARFHIAESYYGKGGFKEAVAAYEQVITIHKGTDWEPQAIYKQGLAYEQLGQTARARTNWELVRRSFPDSSAYMLATQALARINK